jgi:(E)-4-hydroxy-3-methylbut-2-enyl-diphosphate synthase
MKASNTQVMVQAYRLLVQKLDDEGLKPYPLHLGVTEAGEAEDGRIKSAVGIGTLLEDGLGDTIRVSLTEEPEFEIPVARALANRYQERKARPAIEPIGTYPINPFAHHRREAHEVFHFGGKNVPRVMAWLADYPVSDKKDLKAVGHHYLPATDKWHLDDQGADFLYAGEHEIPFMVANGSRAVYDAGLWEKLDRPIASHPLFRRENWIDGSKNPHSELNFLLLNEAGFSDEDAIRLKDLRNFVLILETSNPHGMAALRRAFVRLLEAGNTMPVLISLSYDTADDSELQLFAATDGGGLLVDGLGDGIMIRRSGAGLAAEKQNPVPGRTCNQLAFGILQAARTRMSKTEYISCPSCGRTLFDLQETTAMIRKRTDHLKGIKIGIMGCIVNGPGEMADADYGYVGVGKDKIALYRGQQVIKKSVPSSQAVDELIDLIREDGLWTEASTLNVIQHN